ncbi:uncharacterized protein LOC125718290 [Brienomyrus brachyistius]|uniref:uncharacterized protein LOC125718290 n=1 Tax=Brienomyrus brachyistius TaxID=42636 RepID=UPI0020B1BDCA|nr:uncharacterized protein LOC125718290 [Brienomyrus brachyistius]XP_048847998.1 uncharacterized protein LOC125718290 [Brienomyrus brachyistius]XP_048847999.1 uncharacterized protein LOC125718290 [Brienomyrus brachyistius]XP_048848000.1 uncharacterized protein LOC125718290 [Brienomyrus brachyistius]
MELSSKKLHPFVSELRIVLLGEDANSVGNSILGREAFETGPTCSPAPQHCERARGVAAGRRLAVISCPDLITLSPLAQTQVIESCFFLSSPGPHVLLVVPKLDNFTRKDLTRVKRILAYWGDAAVNHTMVLVSDSAHKNSAVQQLIKDCGGRVHELSARYMTETRQVAQLVEKMEQMVREKEGQYLSPEDCQESNIQVEGMQDAVPPEKRKKQQDEEIAGKSSSHGQPESVKSGSSSAEDLKQDIWTLPEYKTCLPVTCGNENGILYRDKLALGETCILVGTRWFTPPGFEVFGGKKSSKNWKKSILCEDTTLHELIQDGHLKTFPRWRVDPSQHEQGRKKSPTHRRSRSLSPDFREEPMQVKDNGDDNENAEQQKEVDLSAFKGNLLTVTCGSSQGILHKHRFATDNSGKCIRTENKWLTPVGFVKQELKLTDPNWMKSILCLGIPLKFLIKKQVLVLHSLLCECRFCSTEEDDLKNQENDDNCFICDDDDELVCCDSCPRSFHHKCHIPTLDVETLGDEWICTFCVMKSSQKWHYPAQMSYETALQKPIADYVLHCHYLLLFLYEEHQKLCYMVKGCKDVRKKPTWLDKVVNALQNNHYSAVGDFVSDIQLIFSNSSSSSWGTFGEPGAKLKDTYEEELRKIFKIQLNC